MKKKERTSLITCTYNRLEHLKLLIASLKIQKMIPDEFIVSDDGSKENIEKFLKDEFKGEKKLKVILVKQEDLGFRASRARNNGARVATGDLLIFIDSDIIMPSDFIETFYKKRKHGRINLSRSIRLSKEMSEKITVEDIKKDKMEQYIDKKQYFYNIERYYKNRFYSIFMKKKQAWKFRSMAFSMYKKDYIKIDGMDEKFIGWGSEDAEFGTRAYFMGMDIQNSHKNNFQFHLWHKSHGSGETTYDMLLEKCSKEDFGGKLEYGYSKTFGDDKYEVIEIC